MGVLRRDLPSEVSQSLCGTNHNVELDGELLNPQFTPMMLETLGFATFGIFGFFCIVSLVLATWLPETKGLQLEHIEQVFREKFGECGTEEAKQPADTVERADGPLSSVKGQVLGRPRVKASPSEVGPILQATSADIELTMP